MDTKKVLGGALVWSVGLLVPMLWHAILMHAAVQQDGYSYSYLSMVKYFPKLPWVVWVYLVAMAVAGASLVLSGMKAKHRVPEQ